MTRKVFELFAATLREVPSAAKRLDLCDHFVKVAKEVNERFDEARFREAANCKVDASGCWVK